MEGFHIFTMCIYIVGAVLNSFKICCVTFQSGRQSLHAILQHASANALLTCIAGCTGLLLTQVPRTSKKEWSLNLQMSNLVHLIAVYSFTCLALDVDRQLALSQKLGKSYITFASKTLIWLGPILCVSSVFAVGLLRKQTVGYFLVPSIVLPTILLSLVFNSLHYRKLKQSLTTVCPIEDSEAGNNEILVETTSVKLSSLHNIESNVTESSTADSILTVNPIDKSHSVSKKQIKSLKSSLKKTSSQESSVPRRVVFVFGVELENWRRVKEFRRLKDEKVHARSCCVLLLCYSFCFVPITVLLLVHYEMFGYDMIFKTAYAMSVSITVVDPSVLLLRFHSDALIRCMRRK